MAARRLSADPPYPIRLAITIREAQILHSMVEYVVRRVYDVDIPQADRDSLEDVAAQLDTELRYQWERNPPPDARSS